MNCQNLMSQLGFECRDIGGDVLRVWSPFTYGGDGQAIGLYVEKLTSGYRITDAYESLMHASAMGANITPARLDAVRKATHFSVNVSDGGEIYASVAEHELGIGVASVLNASLAVSHFESRWKPRARAESFAKAVATVLESALGARVIRNVSVVGASGHQLDLPLAVQTADSLIYVQPVAADAEDKVDWQAVYASYGRMTDLKGANIEGTSRLVVMEDAANDAETKKALKVLSASAGVIQYSNLPTWAKQKAA